MKPTTPSNPRSDPAPSVETVGVTKVYRVGHVDYPALRGVSLRIERGELISIIGVSGSGKSTLLNIIGALDPPTSGRVIIDGIDLKKLDEDRLALLRNLRIGFIYQSFNLIQRLTSIENVEMPLIARGTPEQARKNRSLKMLSAVGLAQRQDLKKHEMEIRQKDGKTRLGKTFEQEILPEDLRKRLGLDGEGCCPEDQAYGVDRAYRKDLSTFRILSQWLIDPVDPDLARPCVWLQISS